MKHIIHNKYWAFSNNIYKKNKKNICHCICTKLISNAAYLYNIFQRFLIIIIGSTTKHFLKLWMSFFKYFLYFDGNNEQLLSKPSHKSSCTIRVRSQKLCLTKKVYYSYFYYSYSWTNFHFVYSNYLRKTSFEKYC